MLLDKIVQLLPTASLRPAASITNPVTRVIVPANKNGLEVETS